MFSLLIDPPSTVNFNSCLVSTGSRKVSMDITGSSIKQHRENQTSVTTVTNTLLTDFIILQHNDNVSVLLLKLNSLINKGIIVNMWGWHDDLLIPTQRSQTFIQKPSGSVFGLFFFFKYFSSFSLVLFYFKLLSISLQWRMVWCLVSSPSGIQYSSSSSSSTSSLFIWKFVGGRAVEGNGPQTPNQGLSGANCGLCFSPVCLCSPSQPGSNEAFGDMMSPSGHQTIQWKFPGVRKEQELMERNKDEKTKSWEKEWDRTIGV